MPLEITMSIEVTFLTVVAVLFAAGFVSGPAIVRKFHLTLHDHHLHRHNGHAH
ncbi:MAG TPA: hypothetical protein VKT73_09105 [Xanthobacteraceae bacterium]|nr:hypothetical protein [Xanthobacteraceae bacterium]